MFDGVKVEYYISKISFARLLIPTVLPNVDKAIYLDSDLIVRTDIAKLYEIDISDYYFAAVEDAGWRYHSKRMYGKETSYYNSGVLLINSKELRRDEYPGKLKKTIFQNKTKYELGDQDVLNDVFRHKIKPLSISWNFHHDSYFTPEMYVGYVDCDKDKFITIMNNPYIRHFTSPRKPWLVGIKRKLKNEYLFYERLTPFYKKFLNIKKNISMETV
ncbi:MAG: glycosyltransferase family 8 protein [Alphaproteobacteria bacterium]|nr:glycosyltransferase family 8 protein [Alphaproteobacteria bacterium]